MHMPMPQETPFITDFVGVAEVTLLQPQDIAYTDQLYPSASAMALSDTVMPSHITGTLSNFESMLGALIQFPLITTVVLAILILATLYSRHRHGSNRPSSGLLRRL